MNAIFHDETMAAFLAGKSALKELMPKVLTSTRQPLFECSEALLPSVASVSEYYCPRDHNHWGRDMDSIDTEYSGLGRRLAAHLVDLVIVFSVLVLHGMTFRILRAVGIWKPTHAEGVSPEELWLSFGVAPKVAVVLAFVVTCGLIYFPVFESSAWQATPGKRLLNIFVARDDRTCLGLGRAVGRWLMKWFAGWFGGSLISMGMIGGLPNHKAIHDCTAGTIVLRGRPEEDGPIEPWRFMAAFGITFAWLLGTFYTIL